jgi:hypothetical protein
MSKKFYCDNEYSVDYVQQLKHTKQKCGNDTFEIVDREYMEIRCTVCGHKYNAVEISKKLMYMEDNFIDKGEDK